MSYTLKTNKHLKFYSSLISSSVICFNALASSYPTLELRSKESLNNSVWVKCSIESSSALCEDGSGIEKQYEIITDPDLIKNLTKELVSVPANKLSQIFQEFSSEETKRLINQLAMSKNSNVTFAESSATQILSASETKKLKNILANKEKFNTMQELYQDKDSGISMAMPEEEFNRLLQERGLTIHSNPNDHPIGLAVIGIVAVVGIKILSSHGEDVIPGELNIDNPPLPERIPRDISPRPLPPQSGRKS